MCPGSELGQNFSMCCWQVSMLSKKFKMITCVAILSPGAAQELLVTLLPECECFQLKHGLTGNNLGASG